MTDKRDVGKLCDSIYGLNPFTSTATEHGKLQEKHGRKKLEELEGVSVHGSGLWVTPDYPFLGASPDGIIGKDTVVEIKCPCAGREKIKPRKNFPFLSVL